jgi:hypothetical protein
MPARKRRKVLKGTWETLRKAPTTLVKLVIQGKATVVGKDSFGRLIYELHENHVRQ